MAVSCLSAILTIFSFSSAQDVPGCGCDWARQGGCDTPDGSRCWHMCCPNSCNTGGWSVAYSPERCQFETGSSKRTVFCNGPSMQQCGTRMSRGNFIGRGYHSIRIKAAPGPGVVTTYYLSNNGGLYDKTRSNPWVELDFEIMGNMAGPGHQSHIWTNMFTDIAVEHNQWIVVPFDVTADFHEYAFHLEDETVSFKVDGVTYRSVDIRHHNDVQASIWSTSLQQFVSVWGQSSSDPGEGIPEFQFRLGLLDENILLFPRNASFIL
mmetsp:Transcript_18038/g.40673  ORF Transcript_18038/g.40673 Transcript_18038/m.40673 type:complete len:265 (-) Transcript_18038:56-850(-)